MDYTSHPYFVADDTAGTRKETAILLVGTAREYGISQQDIASTRGGYYITERLADVLYDDTDTDPEPEPEPAPAKKSSGNRAAKDSTSKKESGSGAH